MTFRGEQYNYLQAVTEDVKDYITENVILSGYDNINQLEDYLNDTLWTEDSVTGNVSGSHTFNRWQAEENLAHNFDLYLEACEEFGIVPTYRNYYPEEADVTIRCYLLSQAIAKALEELDIGLYFDNPEEFREIYTFGFN